jgi:hypothetical protein
MNGSGNSSPGFLGDWIVSFYAWLFAATFGIVLLDVVYAGTMRTLAEPDVSARVFTSVADFLLIPLGLTVLAGVAAALVAAERRLARNLVVASLLVILAPIPVLVLFGSELAAAGAGTPLRLGLGACGSLLAMAAARAFVIDAAPEPDYPVQA